ncbi:ATP-dependent RNA helicase DDX19A-like [Uloborus diversus]|uniref:ATP-dependent RNA helicase DDX19A-like n=1 Tax=Uloborus diversus TaxID=327109 RepID=UPI002409033F|nr:ATP-dependent RNA helicase DDX19A-like [Uloborus diversus]
MADVDDWGLSADLQEKSIANLVTNLNIQEPIPPPVPSSNHVSSNSSTNASVPDDGGENDKDEEEEPELNAAEISLMKKLVRSHLIEVSHDVDIQSNPNSPLYSVKSFDELNLRPELLKGVYDMGFTSPSKIQETVLPTLIADPPQNMIAQSQSGTGKTAAFTLASLSRVDTNLKYPHVLILSPTYELAMQTGNVAKQIAKFCPSIEFCFAVRGEHLERGEKITAQFLIGTPGKVFDWAMKFRFFDLKKIKVFVLDEADVMISTQGYQDQSIRIHKQLPKTCQMMLFSATYSEEVMQFAELIVNDPIIIKLKREEESLENIKQYYIVCKNQGEKFDALCNIYGTIAIGQAIIFCHTKKTASWLSEKMAKDGHAVALLSGDLTVEQRIAVLNRFREGKEKVLITTNVCARGIDIEQVTVVINFDLPMNQNMEADFETYLHRIGRTGRFGKSGLAINMIDGNRSMSILKDIEKHFGRKIAKVDANEIEDLEEMGKR